ncbi:MAG: DEAD/DEAH box helicase [Endozoicomonadaceae bacterium]|nr:DEAD/DEAH box helicase [Endozoicomonadaceae bacterium]
MYSQTDLIANKKTKDILFDLLRESEVEEILKLLDQNISNNVFRQLKKIKVTKNNKARFHNYFEIIDTEETNVKPPSVETIPVKYSLFDHQIKASIETIKLLQNQDKNRAILHMPTGSGKTRTAMHIIASYLSTEEETTVIWLAYSEELCEQAVEEFIKSWQYLGNRETNVYRFWGSNNVDNLENIKDGFIVAGLPKMVGKAKKSIEFIQNLSKNTSLVVIDEAHQAVAQTYSVVLDLLVPNHKNKPHLLGLTATPGRTWLDMNEDEKLSDFFFKQKYSLSVDGFDNPIDYLVEEEYLAKATFEPLYYDFGYNLTAQDIKKIQNSIDIPKDVLDKMAQDTQRSMLIVQKIIELLKQAKRIIVFASTVEHSKLLSSALRYKNINAKSVTGDTPHQDRNNIINEFKQDDEQTMVICNYAVLTTGFDTPKISIAVIARPTKSLVLYSQMVGRAIRGVRAGGNKEARIVTVVDKNLSSFGNVAEAFNNWNDVWENK